MDTDKFEVTKSFPFMVSDDKCLPYIDLEEQEPSHPDPPRPIPSPGSSSLEAPTQGPYAPVPLGYFACPEHTMYIQMPVPSSVSP